MIFLSRVNRTGLITLYKLLYLFKSLTFFTLQIVVFFIINHVSCKRRNYTQLVKESFRRQPQLYNQYDLHDRSLEDGFFYLSEDDYYTEYETRQDDLQQLDRNNRNLMFVSRWFPISSYAKRGSRVFFRVNSALKDSNISFQIEFSTRIRRFELFLLILCFLCTFNPEIQTLCVTLHWKTIVYVNTQNFEFYCEFLSIFQFLPNFLIS